MIKPSINKCLVVPKTHGPYIRILSLLPHCHSPNTNSPNPSPPLCVTITITLNRELTSSVLVQARPLAWA